MDFFFLVADMALTKTYRSHGDLKWKEKYRKWENNEEEIDLSS